MEATGKIVSFLRVFVYNTCIARYSRWSVHPCSHLLKQADPICPIKLFQYFPVRVPSAGDSHGSTLQLCKHLQLPSQFPFPSLFIEEKPVFIPGGPLILVLPSSSQMGTGTYRGEQSNPTTFPLHSLLHRDPPLSPTPPPLPAANLPPPSKRSSSPAVWPPRQVNQTSVLELPSTSPPCSFLLLLLGPLSLRPLLSAPPPLAECSHALVQPCVLLDLSLQQMPCV